MASSSCGVKMNGDKELITTHKKGGNQSQSLSDLTAVSNAELFKRINALLGNTLETNHNRDKDKYPSDATLSSFPMHNAENEEKHEKKMHKMNDNLFSSEGLLQNSAFFSNLQGLTLLNQISALCHQNNDVPNPLENNKHHDMVGQTNGGFRGKNVPLDSFFCKNNEDANEQMKRLMNVCGKEYQQYGRPILGSTNSHYTQQQAMAKDFEYIAGLSKDAQQSKSFVSSSPIHASKHSSMHNTDFSVNNYEKDDSSFLSSGSFASDNDLCAILNNLSLKSSSFSNWSSLSGASGDGCNGRNRAVGLESNLCDNMELRYAPNPSNKKLAFLNSFFASTTNDPYSIERAAKLYRNAAAICDATYTWSGQLPPRIYRNPIYSCKIFLGGVPWDITEMGLINCFKLFGNVRIEWPGKDTCHPRYPPKGYVYILFDSDKSVRALLQSCTHDFSNGGDWYFKISSKRMRCKEVQVIPWVISDSNFVRQPSQRLDPCKTVFVGALHGLLNAEGLAQIINDLFGGVVYAGVDTDKYKYPIGSGRVTFNNHKSYMKAVSAAFVEIKTPKFVKRVQIDPYLEDAICSICSVQPGPYFCREMVCFKYFCKNCWYRLHTIEALKTHKPLMRNSKKEI